MTSKRISIIGLGYVGLCTSIGFACNGFSVTIVDIDQQKIDLITKGIPP
ncbi:MAG: UDP-glucose 6-dehydrogenase, partial [Candidatus Bathyarchaeota archaeon]